MENTNSQWGHPWLSNAKVSTGFNYKFRITTLVAAILSVYLTLHASPSNAATLCESLFEKNKVDWRTVYEKLSLNPEMSQDPEFYRLLLDRYEAFAEKQFSGLKELKQQAVVQVLNHLNIDPKLIAQRGATGFAHATGDRIDLANTLTQSLLSLVKLSHETDHVIFFNERPLGHNVLGRFAWRYAIDLLLPWSKTKPMELRAAKTEYDLFSFLIRDESEWERFVRLMITDLKLPDGIDREMVVKVLCSVELVPEQMNRRNFSFTPIFNSDVLDKIGLSEGQAQEIFKNLGSQFISSIFCLLRARSPQIDRDTYAYILYYSSGYYPAQVRKELIAKFGFYAITGYYLLQSLF